MEMLLNVFDVDIDTELDDEIVVEKALRIVYFGDSLINTDAILIAMVFCSQAPVCRGFRPPLKCAWT